MSKENGIAVIKATPIYIGIIIAMSGWWLAYAKELPTKADIDEAIEKSGHVTADQVRDILDDDAPYLEDKALIMDSLKTGKEERKENAEELKKMSEKITQNQIDTNKMLNEILREIQKKN